MFKICPDCNESKPLELFQKDNTKSGYGKRCLICFRLYRNTRMAIPKVRLKQREYQKTFRANNPGYWKDHTNLERKALSDKEYKKIWNQNNPDKLAAIRVRRRYNERQAIPKWLTQAHLNEIQAIYLAAKETNMEVDHIIPLQSKYVCGLHVPWNLQLLTSIQNKKKGNKLILE